MAFHWQDYIKIGAFPPAVTARITEALDNIALAHDNEGIELLKKATRNGKLPMRIDPGDRTVGMEVDGAYYLSLNIEKISQLAYGPQTIYASINSAGARHTSLTGVLVHELYHAGDVLTSKKALQQKAEAETIGLLNKNGVQQSKHLFERFLNMYKGKDATYPYALMMDCYGNRESTIEAFKTHGYRDIAEMLEKIYPDDAEMLWKKLGFFSENGVPRWEQDAVSYTDAFMWKNFGNAEPQRQNFRNVAMLASEGMPRVLKVDAVAHETLGFLAPDPNPSFQKQLPHIRAVNYSPAGR